MQAEKVKDAKNASKEVKSRDEARWRVRVTQSGNVMQQQKDTFVALLQQQQENFKDFVQIILDSTNTRPDAISQEIQEFKVSLQSTQKEVDDLKADSSKQAECCNTMQADCYKVYDTLLTITDKMENL